MYFLTRLRLPTWGKVRRAFGVNEGPELAQG